MTISNIKKDCCMCKNCYRVCKFDAITFCTDEYGFEYATINENKCVNCNQCSKYCPIMKRCSDKTQVFESGVAYSINEELKRQGSSGGLFGCFANEIIRKGGVVYGAAFDETLKLKTTRAISKKELFPLYKSKYLLCDTNSQFEQIERDLKDSKIVLYCSTPCQIDALKIYLQKEYDNLYTIDFVCHGVSSQLLFDYFKQLYEDEKSVIVKSFMFREKVNKPTSSHYFLIDYEKNNKSVLKKGLYYEYPYYNAYCKQIILRPNCYSCLYARKNRVSDISIGDFHNVENYIHDIDRFSGISMFICNSEKGKKLFKECENQLFIRNMDAEILYENNRFTGSEETEISTAICQSKQFIKEVLSNGMTKKAKRILISPKDYLKKIYYYSPKFIRKIVKGLVQ